MGLVGTRTRANAWPPPAGIESLVLLGQASASEVTEKQQRQMRKQTICDDAAVTPKPRGSCNQRSQIIGRLVDVSSCQTLCDQTFGFRFRCFQQSLDPVDWVCVGEHPPLPLVLMRVAACAASAGTRGHLRGHCYKPVCLTLIEAGVSASVNRRNWPRR